jgi:hypothetical protein
LVLTGNHLILLERCIFIELHSALKFFESITMAQAQANSLFGDILGSTQYAKDVLTSHLTLTAAYFVYEQNSAQSDLLFLTHAKEQAISKGLDKTGRFLPYWYRDTAQQNAVTLAPLIEIQSSLYYQG